jgi:hypothetical protein
VDKYIRKLDTDAKRLEVELIRPELQDEDPHSTLKKSMGRAAAGLEPV